MVDGEDQDRMARRTALEERLRVKRRRERKILVGCVLALLLVIAVKWAFEAGRRSSPRRRPAAPQEADTPARSRVRIHGGRAARARKVAEEHPDFVLEGEQLVWTDGAARRYEVAEVQSRGLLVLRTEAGPLKVAPSAWREKNAGPPAVLTTLLAHARREEISLVGAVFHDDDFEPPHIRITPYRIVAGGTLRATTTAPTKGRARLLKDKRRLEAATQAYIQALQRAPLDEGTRTATADVIGAITRGSGNFFSSLAPHVTRRLIRHGWLRQVGAPEAETLALEQAVRAAARPIAMERMEGPGGSFTRYRDMFGRKLEVFETAEGTWYTCPQPRPQWLGFMPPRTVEVQLPPGGDPFGEVVEPIAARLRQFDGHWKKGGVLEIDAAAWQRTMQPRGGRHSHPPANLFPPHALLMSGFGDALLLVTAHGTVRPGRDPSPAERKRFFDEAATALPDVAHMDLIGEILYTYAWDTAEYDRPLLIGTEAFNGDIHQTADQTLETCCGGIYRGDCDDLACFYHALTTHQGRNAHVLSLPHHLANAYAEQREDGSWQVAVLHTGPPLLIRGRTLEAAIRKTYESFNSQESINLGGLPLSLRFGGDAVRQRYMLPFEIFGDARYARDLIEVQAAYRFHTYRTGIETMEAILARREAPTVADHRETAHLLTWANRDADATPHFEKGLAASTADAGRVEAALDLLGNLVTTKQPKRARALAGNLAEIWIPAFERSAGQRLLQPWIGLASALLADPAHHLLAMRILASSAEQRVGVSLSAIEEVAGRKGFDPRRLHYNGLPRHTTNVNRYVNLAVRAMSETRTATDGATLEFRQKVDAVLQRWFRTIAFRTLHANASVLGLYGSVASYYEGHVGPANLEAMVSKAGPPTSRDLLAARRPPPITATPAPQCLRMIRLAAGYHRARWWRGFGAAPDAFDAKATKAAIYAELAARDTATRRGLGHHSDPNEFVLAQLALAALAGDAKAARPLFAQAASRRDFRLDNALIDLLTIAAARHAPDAWMPLVEAWADEVGRTPDHFKLAWAAMRSDHPAHAQAAGRMAVARHPQREDFARELEHLAQVAAQKAAAAGK